MCTMRRRSCSGLITSNRRPNSNGGHVTNLTTRKAHPTAVAAPAPSRHHTIRDRRERLVMHSSDSAPLFLRNGRCLCIRTGSATSKETHMPDGKPNILVIWGDDIGITNLSCYSDG